MRLTKDEVTRVVAKILQEWKIHQAVVFPNDETRAKNLLVQAIVSELEVEDQLNADVEKFLAKYEPQFQSGELDRKKMFAMVKAQLAKEKKLVL